MKYSLVLERHCVKVFSLFRSLLKVCQISFIPLSISWYSALNLLVLVFKSFHDHIIDSMLYGNLFSQKFGVGRPKIKVPTFSLQRAHYLIFTRWHTSCLFPGFCLCAPKSLVCFSLSNKTSATWQEASLSQNGPVYLITSAKAWHSHTPKLEELTSENI